MLGIKAIAVLFSLRRVYSLKEQVNDANMSKQTIVTVISPF